MSRRDQLLTGVASAAALARTGDQYWNRWFNTAPQPDRSIHAKYAATLRAAGERMYELGCRMVIDLQ